MLKQNAQKNRIYFFVKFAKDYFFLSGVPSSISFTFFAHVVMFSPWNLAWYLEKNKKGDSTLSPAKWQRQAYRASRWTAAWMFDLWFKLFCGATPVHALSPTALCMAITWEWNLAFQLHLGYIAVFHIHNGYSFNPIPDVINGYWSKPLQKHPLTNK